MKRLLSRQLLALVKKAASRLDCVLQPAWSDHASCDLAPALEQIAKSVRPYTMTSYARIVSLIQGVEHVARNRIGGAIVECGVWRGGSMMAVAGTLRQRGDVGRDLYLFDTFAGMTEPSEHDGVAYKKYQQLKSRGTENVWCEASLDDVMANLRATGYPREKLHFIRGDVLETIPDQAPDRIALLRLDTDWYESTRHELIHLFDRLAPGGLLVLDDYGHWPGCKKAVDEFFAAHRISMFLSRVDYTGRIGVKHAA